MKNHKRFVLSCVFGTLILGVSSGAALFAHTVATYSGACSKLNGFPGLLQSAGFLPFGNCRLVLGKCPTRNVCSVGGKKGTCEEVHWDDKNRHACVCIPKGISR
jgi:hypothetical protein